MYLEKQKEKTVPQGEQETQELAMEVISNSTRKMEALTGDSKYQRKVKRSSKGACYTRKTRHCGFTGNNEARFHG